MLPGNGINMQQAAKVLLNLHNAFCYDLGKMGEITFYTQQPNQRKLNQNMENWSCICQIIKNLVP